MRTGRNLAEKHVVTTYEHLYTEYAVASQSIGNLLGNTQKVGRRIVKKEI